VLTRPAHALAAFEVEGKEVKAIEAVDGVLGKRQSLAKLSVKICSRKSCPNCVINYRKGGYHGDRSI
jgi:hypothetical protein